jgi:serine/threonine protein phosphatase 1
MNIIGDIAGNYKTLMALVAQMPDEPFMSLGDMIDRGPRSKEVLDFFMKPGNSAILGNHEHMMLSYCKDLHYYGSDIWLYRNGGMATKNSFMSESPDENFVTAKKLIPEVYLEWLSSLPFFYETEDLFVSHAAKNPILSMKRVMDQSDYDDNILWNRGNPRRMPGKFQVYGHNYGNGKMHKDEQGDFAICIDATGHKKIMGIHWPSKQIYTQDFID